jgi:hypothetical protein
MSEEQRIRRSLPRFDVRTERLTYDERRFILRLGMSAARAAQFLGMSDQTFSEIMQPLGRVKPATVARIRARIAELQNSTQDKNSA